MQGSDEARDQESALLAKTAAGAGWVVAWRMITRLLGLVSTLTLARLLGPGDFGLVALASGFTQTIDAVSDLSVQEALVRERAPDRAMYDTAFTMSLIRGLVTAGLVAAAALPAAAFFREPRLGTVLLALAAANLIAALENVATADFMRTFAFRKEFQLWTLPRVIQVFATIGFALIWPTYWALVFGIVLGRTLRTIMSYAMYPYMPRLTLSSWRRIVGFTTWSWAIYMVVVLRDRIDTFMVGRFFASAQVGIYALGAEIAALPTSELIDPLCRACFPSFSQLRHEGMSAGRAYVRLFGAAATIVLPAGFGLAAVAAPLVQLAFGPNWSEAIPMIRILGVAAVLGIAGNLSVTLFSAYAMLPTTFTITACVTVLRGAALLAFLPGGTMTTAALTIATAMVAEQAMYLALTIRRFGIRVVQLAGAVHRCALAAMAMAGVLWWSGLGYQPATSAPATDLITAAASGAGLYVLVLGVLWLAEGRPAGPEQDLLRIAGRVAHTVARRIRPASIAP